MYAIGINAANSRAQAVTVNKTHLVGGPAHQEQQPQGYFTQKPHKTSKHTRTSSSAVTGELQDSSQRNKYAQYNTVGNSQDLEKRTKQSIAPSGKIVTANQNAHSRDAAQQQQNSSHQRGKTEFDFRKNIEQILTLQQQQQNSNTQNTT